MAVHSIFRREKFKDGQNEAASGGQAVILGLAVLFVFLVLAAQYESWTSPAAVIAVVPLAALGVVLVLMARGACPIGNRRVDAIEDESRAIIAGEKPKVIKESIGQPP